MHYCILVFLCCFIITEYDSLLCARLGCFFFLLLHLLIQNLSPSGSNNKSSLSVLFAIFYFFFFMLYSFVYNFFLRFVLLLLRLFLSVNCIEIYARYFRALHDTTGLKQSMLNIMSPEQLEKCLRQIIFIQLQ